MLHAVLEKHFFVTPPAEYQKRGVLCGRQRDTCTVTNVRHGGWQDHFEKTMLELGFERLKSEPGCFVKKEVAHKDTNIVAVHVDDLLSARKRKHLDNCFVQLEKTLKLKRVEFIENGKSVLFLGDYITKFKDKITLKSKDAYVDNLLGMLGMESCKPKRPRRIGQLWASRCTSRETPFRLALRGNVSGNGEFLANQGSHETSETSFALHSRKTCIWPSTIGGLLMLGGACVAGWSRTQKPTALSSGESEFYSATVCACELLWACTRLRALA